MSNMPQGDFWELVDNAPNSQHYGQKFKFDFSNVESKNIKDLLKAYTWRNYREQNLSLRTIYEKINSQIPHFLDFSKQNNIKNLATLTNNDVDMFLSYLNTLRKSNGEKYTLKYKKICLDALKSIVRWGQLNVPDKVPKTEIFTGNEFKDINKRFEIDEIPDEILSQINKALISEENVYLKNAIIILQSTGMRVGELINLKVDCFVRNPITEEYNLRWYDYKNRKERELKIPDECKIAVDELIKYTKEIRKEADNKIKDKLFIHIIPKGKKAGEVGKIPQRTIRNWLKSFIEKHGIRDGNGELFDIISHQFRRTLGTHLLSDSGDINLVQQALGLASANNAKRYYARTKNSKKAEIFNSIGIIGNIEEAENFVEDKNELEWFKKNKDTKARMVDGYCTKPFKDGEFCDRLLKRKKCLTCKKFITTPEFLETHREYLKELELELENNIYGEHYAEHLKPTIEVLREIIKKLEELQNESAVTANHK